MQSKGYKRNRVIVLITIFLLLLVGNVNISESSDATTHSNAQMQNLMEPTLNGTYFKALFNLSKEELISRFGENYIEGTTTVEKSHIILPCLYYKDLGLTFILGDGMVRYIRIYSETNNKGINVNGAKPGMNFEEICNKLGEAEVNETWEATKTIKAYEIHYGIDGLVYKFLSRYQDGRASKLIITDDR
jgi:hypothetical protein